MVDLVMNFYGRKKMRAEHTPNRSSSHEDDLWIRNLIASRLAV
jgi:truncated hemoglobin YjbI